MGEIKLLAVDLDGTLLTDGKAVAPRDLRAIQAALNRGVTVVPASGRTYPTFPEEVRTLRGLRYAVTCNGARVLDTRSGQALRTALIPLPTVLELIRELEGIAYVMEAGLDDCLYITAADAERELSYVPPSVRPNLIPLREETPDLPELLRARGRDVDKVLLFFPNEEETERAGRILAGHPELAVSFSLRNNLEINASEAGKGAAVLALARHLGIDRDAVMAIGDSGNDAGMLRSAGLGVAMGNAPPEIQSAADAVTETNNDCGVGAAVEKYILHDTI